MPPDGRRAITAAGDTLQLWDLDDSRELLSFPIQWPVPDLAIDHRAQVAVSASSAQLEVWSLDERVKLEKPRRRAATVTDIAVSADGRRAVSGCDDGSITVWDAEAAKAIHTIQAHKLVVLGRAANLVGGIQRMAVRADGRRAVTFK